MTYQPRHLLPAEQVTYMPASLGIAGNVRPQSRAACTCDDAPLGVSLIGCPACYPNAYADLSAKHRADRAEVAA